MKEIQAKFGMPDALPRLSPSRRCLLCSVLRVKSELLAMTPDGRTIGVAVHVDAIEVIDLLLFTSLKPRSNGATRSKKPRS